MSWLRRKYNQYVDVQSLLDQVSQGIIPVEDAAIQLQWQGQEVCSQLSSMYDSYGNLAKLSDMLGCSNQSQPGMDQNEPGMDQNEEMLNENT